MAGGVELTGMVVGERLAACCSEDDGGVVIDWSGVVRRYGALVYGTAMRLLGDEADAADCFQATFLGALEASRRGEVGHWGGLLKRIATARAIDILRKRRRERERLADGCDVALEAGRSAGPAQVLEGAELGERLREALGGLPETQAEVFCMRYVEQLSYEEIADAMGLNRSNVGVLLHRARRGLKDALCGGEDGTGGAGERSGSNDSESEVRS